MDVEKLPRGTYDSNNQDFKQCEELWIEEPIESFKQELISTQKVLSMTQPDVDTTHLDWVEVKHTLSNGRSVELIKGYYRMKTDYPKCPLCASSMVDYNIAISRRDNETEICSICGAQEALDDAVGIRR